MRISFILPFGHVGRFLAVVFLGINLAGWACAQVSEARPAQSGAVAELQEVWSDMQLGRWNDTEEKLATLKNVSDPEVLCQARLAEGNLWQFRRPGPDPLKAAACYEWIVDHHPQSAIAPWALLALARLPELDVLAPRPADAVPIYRRVASQYPESAASQEAMLHLAQALWKTGGIDGAREGVAELQRWRSAHPDPNYELHVQLLLGKLYRYPLCDYRKSVDHLQSAFRSPGMSLIQRAASCWTIATLAEHELKDRALAVEYYTRFLREFPGHRTTFMAKQGLMRLGAPIPDIPDVMDQQPPTLPLSERSTP